MHGMDEGQPIRIFISLQGGFVHQAADGKMRHQQTEELLLDQFWRLAAQYNLSAAQMGLQFVQSGFDLPTLVIQGGRRLPKIRKATSKWECGIRNSGVCKLPADVFDRDAPVAEASPLAQFQHAARPE